MNRRLTASLATTALLAAVGLLGACSGTTGPEDTATPTGPTTFGSAKATAGKGDQLDLPSPDACPGGGPRLVDGEPAAWTWIVWSAGDNNLEDQLVEDINEMERGHTGSPNVNVLVQLDRESEDGAWRYLVQPDGDKEKINSKLVAHSDEELDSGNWKNFAAYGQWATVCYPAERYAVVIEGHGGGWSPPPSETDEDDGDTEDDRSGRLVRTRENGEPARLIAPDDTNGTEMTMTGLRKALHTIRGATRRPEDPDWKNRLSLYGSDACIMQTLEVLYELQDTASYVVGSAENEPGPGWPYYTVIDDLTTRPFYYAQTPAKLGQAIVDNYGKSYGSRGGQGDREDYTLSVVDTRHVDAVTHDMQKVGGLMLELMDELKPYLSEARDNANPYGGWGAIYVDVEKLLVNLRGTLIAEGKMPERGARWDGDERWRDLRDAINNVVVESKANLTVYATFGPELEGVGGLSIYMPDTASPWRLSLEEYGQSPFGVETGWAEVVNAVVQ